MVQPGKEMEAKKKKKTKTKTRADADRLASLILIDQYLPVNVMLCRLGGAKLRAEISANSHR